MSFLDRTAEAHFVRINERSYELLDLHPGARVLDVGCGTGDGVRRIRERMGEAGEVIGDRSAQMIAVARERDRASQWPSHFEEGDVAQLACESDSFDAARASRFLVHMADPASAVRELVRVTKSKRPVVAIEPDFETMVLAHADSGVTRAVLQTFCGSFASGTVGRWLPGLFRDAGLMDVLCEPVAIPLDAAFLLDYFQIGSAATEAATKGLISHDESERFSADLKRMRAQAHLVATATVFLVCGYKGPALNSA